MALAGNYLTLRQMTCPTYLHRHLAWILCPTEHVKHPATRIRLSYDRVKMAKMDPQTVARLQGRAPGVSFQDAAEVQGLVLSGAVFPVFTSRI